jgi:hypothetical protein
MWEPDHSLSRAARKAGLLPEIHVWVGCAEPQQLVDLSTGSLPKDCKAKLGIEWQADLPPDYLWADYRVTPAARYEPCLSATWFAVLQIWNKFHPEYARPIGLQAEKHNITLEKVLEYEKRQEANYPLRKEFWNRGEEETGGR